MKTIESWVQDMKSQGAGFANALVVNLNLSGILKVPFYACFWVASPEPFGQFFLNTNLKQRKEFAQ